MGRRWRGRGPIVDRLNREGIPGTGGKRWNKTPVDRILKNERYLGRQIWGQKSVEREPALVARSCAPTAREEWKVIDRPELRIVSDELWARTQATRKAIREAVAPKGNLARGQERQAPLQAPLHRLREVRLCGGAMSSVSGGKGSPRFGCRRSWQEGTSACPNRLTIRIKVTEPQILAKLQGELLQPKTVAYIAKAVEREVKKALAPESKGRQPRPEAAGPGEAQAPEPRGGRWRTARQRRRPS